MDDILSVIIAYGLIESFVSALGYELTNISYLVNHHFNFIKSKFIDLHVVEVYTTGITQ